MSFTEVRGHLGPNPRDDTGDCRLLRQRVAQLAGLMRGHTEALGRQALRRDFGYFQ